MCDRRNLYLPPAYVVRREGNVLTRVCPSIHPSICLSTGGGRVPISHNALQHFPECYVADTGGTLPGPAGGVPCWGVHSRGGTLPGGYPARSSRGTLPGGYPAGGGYLPGGYAGGYPAGGGVNSQVRTGGGGTQLGQQKE